MDLQILIAESGDDRVSAAAAIRFARLIPVAGMYHHPASAKHDPDEAESSQPEASLRCPVNLCMFPPGHHTTLITFPLNDPWQSAFS
jgi:hypothetical protein